MSTQTEHLKLDLREAADIFNPLSTNANFESLDNIIYEIQTKGGVPTYTTTAAANLLKLSQNPTPNVTVFKFVAAGNANTWSYQETVNNIVALDGTQKTVKAGEMYVAWVNSANAMVVIAWPDVVNAQTFDGKAPAEWATKAQLDAVNQTAANATTTAQSAATVANNALEVAQAAGMVFEEIGSYTGSGGYAYSVSLNKAADEYKFIMVTVLTKAGGDTNILIMLPDSSLEYACYAPRFNTGSDSNFVYRDFSISADHMTLNAGACSLVGDNTPLQANMLVRKVYGIK